MVDDITDIKIDDDLDILLDDTNDIATTEYENTPLQSVFIHIKNVMDRYVGRTVTTETLNQLADDISTEIVEKDPQIDSVTDVSVSYSQGSNEVSASVSFVFNQQFETVDVTGEI